MSGSAWMLVALFLGLIAASECNTKSDCGVAQTAFGMCVPYVMGLEREVSSSCCAAVKAVRDLSPTPTTRKGICDCLRRLMAQVGKLDVRRASSLAGKCGVTTRVIPTSLRFRCF